LKSVKNLKYRVVIGMKNSGFKNEKNL
jgi:hypothetical protein